MAGEEKAWGQTFLELATPHWMRLINAQGQMTLHNVEGMNGNNEFLRLGFGLFGLVGVALNGWPRLRPLAAPRLLTSWCVVISAQLSKVGLEQPSLRA